VEPPASSPPCEPVEPSWPPLLDVELSWPPFVDVVDPLSLLPLPLPLPLLLVFDDPPHALMTCPVTSTIAGMDADMTGSAKRSNFIRCTSGFERAHTPPKWP
jgi:hypothetical protein